MTINLPVHPRTGVKAIGLRRDGRPIWPVMGGDGTTPPPAPAPPAPPAPPGDPAAPPNPTPPAEDKPLGPAGERALQAERDARKALEQELAPLKQLAAALGGKPTGGKTEIDIINERLAAQDKIIADQNTALLRSDVATVKKLTAEQAAELHGATREELAAHADKLLALFGKPAEPEGGGRRHSGPKPDPAQGPRPGTAPSGRDAGRAEAEKRFGKKPATT